MDYDDDLKISPKSRVRNGRANNGRDTATGDAGASGGSGADNTTSIDGISGAGDDAGTEDFGTSGTGRGSDGDSRILSLRIDGDESGIGGTAPRHRSGARSNRRRNISGAGDSADGSNGATESGKKSTSQDIPREVGFRSLRGKSSAADIQITQTFVSEIWTMLFSAAAIVTRDGEWKIDDGDATELGTRTVALLKGLDKKSADKLEKKIARFAPALSLLMAVVMIVGPRLSHTRSLRKNALNLRQEKPDSGTKPAAPTASTVGPDAGLPSRDAGNNGKGGPVNAVVTPFRREDFGKIYGDDD